MQGTVALNTGLKLPGVSVTLIGTDHPAPSSTDPEPSGNTSIHVTAVTDANGHFEFTNVPAGVDPATETGAEIQVPLFINTGDKLKVDSRDGSYLGRVNA